MDIKTDESIAKSLETKSSMLKYMPQLLEDLWEMGCSSKSIINLVESLEFKKDDIRILDLGCGKGAVSLQLAKKFGYYALGIDACEDFIQTARQKALEMDLQERCSFELGDIRDFVKTKAEYDLVVYASLGNVLGNFKEIVGHLRNVVRQGGYIIIDDGYLKNDENVVRPGYEHYTSHASTLKQLLAHGDKLIKEMSTDEESKIINYEYLEKIRKRGEEIIWNNSKTKNDIEEYIKYQEEECRFIDKYISGTVWLIKKS